ncbi:ABC transporter ATP-binding protein [Nakamurella lactea]|uniref:ABC transporter ATP-binding protein n=1 Tax=Nakamurella lactea TaxID=459515 RepID=UPI0006872745|nr:ATP-binding cassette domain-containing protein [Nakamurella lactea]
MTNTPRTPELGTHQRVSVRDLRVRYGHATALAGVDLDLEPGKINAIVGQNGAGKSSLLLAMYGAVPSSGSVSVGGQDISDLKPAQRARRGIGLVPQGRQIFPTLTVRENLAVYAEVLDAGHEAVEAAIRRFPRLLERANTLSGNLSGGEQQMLAVTRALMTDSRVLLFDEMATGLAPVIVQQLIGVAKELAADGSTVVMAEASIGAIVADIDRGYLLTRGEIVDVVEGGAELEERYRASMGVVG